MATSLPIDITPVIDRDIRQLMDELLQEIQQPEDNAAQVLNILETHGFHSLSEDTKNSILNNKVCINIWSEIMKLDKVNTMKALLPLTPLYTIAKDGIPAGYDWIQSPEWMQSVLFDHKLRWNSIKCECKSHSHPTNDKEKLCALTDLAFTMFVVDLVLGVCTVDSINNCICFLVKQVPGLFNITKSLYSSMVGVETQNSRSITAQLQQTGRGVIAIEVGDKLKELYTYTVERMGKSTVHIGRATESLLQGHEKEIGQYRDCVGSNLLHILYEQAHKILDYQHDELVSATTALLRVGVDANARNWEKHVPLDVLIDSVFGNITRSLFTTRRSITEYISTINAFLKCVIVLMAWSKRKGLSQIQLLSISNYKSTEEMDLCLIEVGELFLDLNLFNHNISPAFHQLIYHKIVKCSRVPLCRLCQPLCKLLKKAMSKSWFDLSAVVRYIYAFDGDIDNLNQHVFAMVSRWCMEHMQSSSSTPHCCLWMWLEFLIQSGVSQWLDDNLLITILEGTQHKSGFIHIPSKLDAVANGNHRMLSHICMLIKSMWMYYPTHKKYLLEYLEKLLAAVSIRVTSAGDGGAGWVDSGTDDGDDDDNDDHSREKRDAARSLVHNLQQTVRGVQPLMLLCRVCIRQHCQWKDAHHLPMPARLIRYIRIGDVSSDHPACKML